MNIDFWLALGLAVGLASVFWPPLFIWLATIYMALATLVVVALVLWRIWEAVKGGGR